MHFMWHMRGNMSGWCDCPRIKKPPIGGFYFFATRARNSVLGRNVTTLRAVITAGSPVFGLWPILSALSLTSNIPKPTRETFSPFTRFSVIVSRTAVTTFSVSFKKEESTEIKIYALADVQKTSKP